MLQKKGTKRSNRGQTVHICQGQKMSFNLNRPDDELNVIKGGKRGRI